MIKVIIIDDQKAVVRSLEHFINQQEDMQVIGAAWDGEEGLRIIKDLQPDIVILDIIMPKLDGIGLLERMKKEYIKKPIIFLASDVTNNKRVLLYQELGVDHPFIKPINYQSLISQIRYYIHGSNTEEEKRIKTIERKITVMLSQLGFEISNKGTSYLKHAILLAVTEPVLMDDTLKHLFKTMAIRTNIANYLWIQWDIEKSIKSMWRYSNCKSVCDKLGIEKIRKPKPKELILILSRKININQ